MQTDTPRATKSSLDAANAVRFRTAAAKTATAMTARLHLLEDEALETLLRATLAELDRRVTGYIEEWQNER